MPAPETAERIDLRVGVSEWTLRESGTEQALRRIVAAGFDAVELLDSVEVDIETSRRVLADSGLAALAICPLYGPSRNFASTESAERRAAAELLRHSIEYATAVAADIVIAVPSDTPVVAPGGRPDALARAAQTIGSVVDELGPGRPTVVIEPLNRYETGLVTTVAQAIELCDAIGSDRVAVMADTFHMNIEEADPQQALRAAGTRLRHLHLADNHRQQPGSGRLDFEALTTGLQSIGYRGSLVIESIPATDSRLAAGLRYVRALLDGSGPG